MNAVDSLRYIGHCNLVGMPVKDIESHAGVEGIPQRDGLAQDVAGRFPNPGDTTLPTRPPPVWCDGPGRIFPFPANGLRSLSPGASRAETPRTSQADIQSDLFYDYRANVDAYPKWQAWMREKQPRLLVLWGKYESSFDPSEEAYRRDVPNAQVHILDAGHFALDTKADQIAARVGEFLETER
jgi:pimeloyl-ACP methyl ester carboxylesterase